MIEVIVKGASNEGKSTVSALIAKALKQHGIKCHVNDMDGNFGLSCVEARLDESLKSMAEKEVAVMVNQENILRSKV